jgi:hypothetical protein
MTAVLIRDADLTAPAHVWRRDLLRLFNRCVTCGIPSRRLTCAGCRWLDEQELQRARAWDEIDPDRNDLASSRELPWTVQGLLSIEASCQQALSPEDIQLQNERLEARIEPDQEWRRAFAREVAALQKQREAEAKDRQRQLDVDARAAWKAGAKDRAKAARTARIAAARAQAQAEARWEAAQQERATAAYQARRQAALAETVRQMRDSDSLAIAAAPDATGRPLELRALASGQVVFWHDADGRTCLTEAPTPHCLCGRYDLIWTPIA